MNGKGENGGKRVCVMCDVRREVSVDRQDFVSLKTWIKLQVWKAIFCCLSLRTVCNSANIIPAQVQ